jgi:hypothetical protein
MCHKLVMLSRKSGVTRPQVTAKIDPPESSRLNCIQALAVFDIEDFFFGAFTRQRLPTSITLAGECDERG